MLEDGSYEAIVVDAGDGADTGSVVLELAVVSGPRKGEVVVVGATGLARDPLDLLAVPVTITVAGGTPTVTLEG